MHVWVTGRRKLAGIKKSDKMRNARTKQMHEQLILTVTYSKAGPVLFINHRATGACVTHAGSRIMFEALSEPGQRKQRKIESGERHSEAFARG